MKLIVAAREESSCYGWREYGGKGDEVDVGCERASSANDNLLLDRTVPEPSASLETPALTSSTTAALGRTTETRLLPD